MQNEHPLGDDGLLGLLSNLVHVMPASLCLSSSSTCRRYSPSPSRNVAKSVILMVGGFSFKLFAQVLVTEKFKSVQRG